MPPATKEADEGADLASASAAQKRLLKPAPQPPIGGGRFGHMIVWNPRLLAAGMAAIVFLAGCGGSSAPTGASKHSSVTAVTPDGLGSLARKMRQPIYWVGPVTNVTYERTLSGDGRLVTVRYLPTGARLGTPKPYLTVGTYLLRDAYAATQRAASSSGAVRLDVSGGAIAFSTKAHPLSAWITYPGSRYQIEVFDPAPGRARKLVSSGTIERVPGSPSESGRPTAVSAKGLAGIAAGAHRPIYWAGPLPNETLELTKMSQGGFLLRYLSPGAVVGVPTPHLTVGTYPIKNALAAVKRLSLVKGSRSIQLAGGGLAVLDPHFPRSVYLAYPSSNYEIEVFDPSLARARRLVSSGRITPVT